MAKEETWDILGLSPPYEIVQEYPTFLLLPDCRIKS